MANFVFDDPRVGVNGRAVTETATYATNAIPVPLGYHAHARDVNSTSGGAELGCGVFQYCQGSNVASAGQFVHIMNNSAVLLAVANSDSYFPVGIAQGALTATNCYGWVQIAGPYPDIALYASGTAFAAGGNLYINADTDSGMGYIQAATANGNLIVGACMVGAVASDATVGGTVYLNYPQAGGVTASI